MSPKSLTGGERQLERGRLQMIHQDFQIIRLNECMLGRAAEKVVRVIYDELIERQRRRYQNGAGRPRAAPCASCPLPGGRNGARVTGHHRDVERSDINAELQGMGGDHAANGSLAQTTFDLPAFQRQITSPVTANGVGRSRGTGDRFPQVGQEDLGIETAVGESDRLQSPDQKLPCQTWAVSLM